MTTPNLGLSELVASQTQPHIPINSSLRRLDGLAQLSVLERAIDTPPGSPAEGDAYIVGATPTGAWDAYDEGDVALFTAGAWIRIAPMIGWLAYVQDEGVYYFRDNSMSPPEWSVLETGGGGGGSTYLSERRVFSVIDERTSPPGSPTEGDTYMIALGSISPSGAWSGWTQGNLAYRNASAWEQVAVKVGDLLYRQDLKQFYLVRLVGSPGYGLSDTTVNIPLFYAATPTTSQLIAGYCIVDYLTIPADFAGSYATVSVVPTSTFILTVKINGTDIGTVTIDTGGYGTLETVSNAEQYGYPGAILTLHAPSSTDATVKGIAVTLRGMRGVYVAL